MAEKISAISGKRFHITGSAKENVEAGQLQQVHYFLKNLVKRILSLGGGFSITAGDEPLSSDGTPLIFDWSIIEAISEFLEDSSIPWPHKDQKPISIIIYSSFGVKLPDRRKDQWKKLLQDKQSVELKKQLPNSDSVGEVLRKELALDGDILISVGGSKGVHRLVTLYQELGKSAIPLDLPVISGISRELSRDACSHPENYFHCTNPAAINARFCQLPLDSFSTDQSLIEELIALVEELISLQIEPYNIQKDLIIDEFVIVGTQLQQEQQRLRQSEDNYTGILVELLNNSLKSRNLHVDFQKPGGKSPTADDIKGETGGLGEPDIFIENTLTREPVTIGEAFIIKSIRTEKSLIQKHLRKVFDYDLTGLPFILYICYVKESNFNKVWTSYQKIVKSTDFKYPLIGDDFQDISVQYSKYSNIRIGRSQHDRDGSCCDCVHIFIKME